MKESLKTKLHEYIKAQPIDLEDLHRLCKLWGYKTATAERCLRPSISPEIQEIRTPKGAIIGYKWRGTDKQQLDNVKDFLATWGTKPSVSSGGFLF